MKPLGLDSEEIDMSQGGPKNHQLLPVVNGVKWGPYKWPKINGKLGA